MAASGAVHACAACLRSSHGWRRCCKNFPFLCWIGGACADLGTFWTCAGLQLATLEAETVLVAQTILVMYVIAMTTASKTNEGLGTSREGVWIALGKIVRHRQCGGEQDYVSPGSVAVAPWRPGLYACRLCDARSKTWFKLSYKYLEARPRLTQHSHSLQYLSSLSHASLGKSSCFRVHRV